MAKQKRSVRRLTAIAVAAVMLFTIGMGGCDTTLTRYRAAAITALESYAYALGWVYYTQANWQRVEGYVEDGIAAINAAEDKEAVRDARDAAKAAVRTVPVVSEDHNDRVHGYTPFLIPFGVHGRYASGTSFVAPVVDILRNKYNNQIIN